MPQGHTSKSVQLVLKGRYSEDPVLNFVNMAAQSTDTIPALQADEAAIMDALAKQLR